MKTFATKTLPCLLISTLALSACGKKFNPHDNDRPANVGRSGVTATDITSAISASDTSIAKASDLNLELKTLKSGKKFEGTMEERLLTLHADRYALAHGLSLARIESKVDEAVEHVTPELTASPFNDFKDALELRIPEITPKKTQLRYNSQAPTIGHIVRKGRANGDAGTDLYLLALHRAAGSDDSFSNLRPVAIYRPGHVLPGYMFHSAKGWHLYGVETTMAGKARVDFGAVSEIKDEALRVVDAEYYLVLKAWSLELSSPADASEQAMGLTAERYGIPRDHWEKEVSKHLPSRKKKDSLHDVLGLAFGKSDTKAGDKKREAMDQRADGAASSFTDPSSLAQ